MSRDGYRDWHRLGETDFCSAASGENRRSSTAVECEGWWSFRSDSSSTSARIELTAGGIDVPVPAICTLLAAARAEENLT